MKIIDKNGKTLIITDLKKAIQQAKLFKGYVDEEHPGFSRRMSAYWDDIYDKLLNHSNDQKK